MKLNKISLDTKQTIVENIECRAEMVTPSAFDENANALLQYLVLIEENKKIVNIF